jgi:hypothetical protein
MKAFRESHLGRNLNPKSQENARQNHVFLQIQLLQISENDRQINGVRVVHRELAKHVDPVKGGAGHRPIGSNSREK